MATKIRGNPDAQTQMILGQIRKIFEPRWLQVFDDGGFCVDFNEEPNAEDELINFANMYGYELLDKEDGAWIMYDFE